MDTIKELYLKKAAAHAAKNPALSEARKSYINAEAELLERLGGEELELLNKMIEAHCEYYDLAFEDSFIQGVEIGCKIAADAVSAA